MGELISDFIGAQLEEWNKVQIRQWQLLSGSDRLIMVYVLSVLFFILQLSRKKTRGWDKVAFHNCFWIVEQRRSAAPHTFISFYSPTNCKVEVGRRNRIPNELPILPHSPCLSLISSYRFWRSYIFLYVPPRAMSWSWLPDSMIFLYRT